MKSVKNLVFFISLSLASVSIIFDWSEYTYNVAFKINNKVVADKFEEISNFTFQTYRKASFFFPYKPKKTSWSQFIGLFEYRDTTSFYKNKGFNIRCAVKSYLYLLQLF